MDKAAACVPVAFVLAAGGSHGAVQVEILCALYERDITPDLIVGSSVGVPTSSRWA